jgi:hypothetical protein
MPKFHRSPPIQYLASFEASARLSNFKAAAKEHRINSRRQILLPSCNTHLEHLCRKLHLLLPINFPLEEAYYFVRKPNTAKQDSYEALDSWLVAIFNDLS